MTVKDLKDFLNSLPEGYDDFKVVSFQPKVKLKYDDTVEFTEFADIELKRASADSVQKIVRVN